MAQPNTQDTQKVFNSATENFKSFVGSVENVSHTKHMEEIYANMTKLFDAFTNGALLQQGANSELLLRTVYRSLNDDFLEIVQDTKAVDKLIEVIKSKQEGIEPEKVDEALVSETTKKVITKTLDPDTCDPMQVVLDFIDELQTSILQVRLNLSREYERRKLEYAKSLAGQQEDLDKLKDESSQQTTKISETLGQVAQDETEWKDAHLNELSKLMEKFNQATGQASDNILVQTLQEDKNLSEIAKEQKKVDWNKLVAGIKGQLKAIEELKAKEKSGKETQQQKALGQGTSTIDNAKNEIGKKVPAKKVLAKEGAPKVPVPNITPDQAKALQEIKDPTEKEKYLRTIYTKNILDGKIKTPIPAPLIRPMAKVEEVYNKATDKADALTQKIDSKISNPEAGLDNSKLQQDLAQKRKEQDKERITLKGVDNLDAKKKPEEEQPSKDEEKKPKEEQPPKDELSQLVPKVSKAGDEAKQAGKTKLQPPQKPKDTKLNVKPSKNGEHTFPIFGYSHPPGGTHVSPQKAQPPAPQPSSEDGSGGSKITKNGVLNTIGKVHENIQKQLNSKKFKNAFMMDYTKIQGGLQKQMKKIDKTESSISKDLDKTKDGIKKLKKPKGPSLIGLLMGGIAPIAFTIIGGLILITLARLALKKWSDTYMPKPDGSTMSILGIPIPGWDTMKSIGLGIWNFVTVGLPNQFNRLKHFIGNVKKQLFGKKGAFRDSIETKNTLRKIIGALIVANTKKAGGAMASIILKVLGLCFCWIPGVQPVCNFLAEFGPALYTFISTQIMLLWSNNKAKAERAAKDQAANQMATGQSQIKHFRTVLLSNAKGVKPFKGQLNAIQGLQTSKRGNGRLPTKGAIMRSVPTHINKNFGNAKDIQSKALEKDTDATNDDIDKRLKSKNSDDLLVQLNVNVGKINSAVQEHMREWVEKTGNRGTSKYFDELGRAKEKAKQAAFANTIVPQINMLDRYILQLSKSQRFKNVKGPLYDPNTGWNPGYRVYASDLRSIIPLKPFESIHKTADVYFGQPADAEADSIGFMPFTWIQDGTKISVHPINYELERAKGIRNLYESLMRELGYAATNQYGYKQPNGYPTDPVQIIKIYSQGWNSWNRALTAKYQKPDDVLFKDRFGKFLQKLRAGQIQGKDNNLETAKNQPQGFLAERFDKLGDNGKAALAGAAKGATIGLAVGGVFGMAVGAAIGSVAHVTAKFVGKQTQNVKRIFNYYKGDPSLEYKEGDSWWERRKKDAIRLKRKAAAALTIREWRGTKASGVKYGDVRDFWLDSGALDLFANGQIMGTVGAAIPLLKFLIKKEMLPKAPSADKSNEIHDLMHWFYEMAGIKGYDWKQAIGDEASQAGFAQVFLEYLKYKVLPQWNRVEKLLSDEITYKTQDTNAKLLKGVVNLNTLMSQKGIFEFMYKHLRFPNMKIKLIDYSNARWILGEVALLDKYRKEMGIPDAEEKERILKGLQKIWPKFSTMTDMELKRAETLLRNALRKGEFEARFSGDYTYVKQLKQYWDKLQSTIQARLDAQAAGGKIVKKAGDVQTKVLEPPPKTLSEMEEEKKKQAAEEAKRKAEQEAKEKAEKEKKLKEEAKRKEELVIAQAKIKAMEAIRKQEQNYEAILEKMINDPGKVTDKELKSLGDEVKNLKQEAENKIAALPREERELKLALIRGDKISEKTFAEIKETAVGLHGNLQEYIDEVNKIPVGSVLAIENTPGGNAPQPVKMQDSDSVDLGDS